MLRAHFAGWQLFMPPRPPQLQHIILALEEYAADEDGASPGLVGPGSEPVDAVHQHGAKKRLGCALTGHLQWLSR